MLETRAAQVLYVLARICPISTHELLHIMCRNVGCFCVAHSLKPVLLDHDECKEGNGGCDSKRKCVNTVGSHSCDDCPAGWANDGDKGCKGLFVSSECVDTSFA